MPNYMTVARKAGQHIFIGQPTNSVPTPGDWRTAAIFGPCERIALAVGGTLADIKLIGMDPSERERCRLLFVALSETGLVNIGLTDEGRGGQLRLVFCFPDEKTLKARMSAAEEAIAAATSGLTDQLLGGVSI